MHEGSWHGLERRRSTPLLLNYAPLDFFEALSEGHAFNGQAITLAGADSCSRKLCVPPPRLHRPLNADMATGSGCDVRTGICVSSMLTGYEVAYRGSREQVFFTGHFAGALQAQQLRRLCAGGH